MIYKIVTILGFATVSRGDELTCDAVKSLYTSQNSGGESCCSGRVSFGDLTCDPSVPKLSESVKTRFHSIQTGPQVAQYTSATNYSLAMMMQFPRMDVGMCVGDDCFHECSGYDTTDTPCEKDTLYPMQSTFRIVRGAVQKRIETMVGAPTKLSPHTFIGELFPAYDDLHFVTAEVCESDTSPGCEPMQLATSTVHVKFTNATRKPMISDFFSESCGIAGRGFEAYSPMNIANQLLDHFPANAKLNGKCAHEHTAAQCLDAQITEAIGVGGRVLLASHWGVHSYASSHWFGGVESLAISERAYAKLVEKDASRTHAYADLARTILLDPIGVTMKFDACEVEENERVREALLFSGESIPYIWKIEEQWPCTAFSKSSQDVQWLVTTGEMLKLASFLARLGRTKSGTQLISAHLVKNLVTSTTDSDSMGSTLTTMLDAGHLGPLALLGTGGITSQFGLGAAQIGSGNDFNGVPVLSNYRGVFVNAPFTGGWWVGANGHTMAWSFEAQTAYVLEVGSHFAGQAISPDTFYGPQIAFIDESARIIQKS